MQHYDAIVIGSGQAGTPLSKKLANSGLKTALIEKRWVGGTCVNDGCSPTKAMIASAKAVWVSENSARLGVLVEHAHVDFPSIIKRKNEIVTRMRENSEKGILETENLDLIYGTAAFSGMKQVTVQLQSGEEQVLTADRIYINTGLKPEVPDIPGIRDIEFLTSTSIMELDTVPEHLLILGSGYIGLEFGQMFRRFGSKVTVIEPSARILKHEEEDIAQNIADILSLEHIDILVKTEVMSLARQGGLICATLHSDGSTREVQCTHVLVAAGREPQTPALNLEMTGVKTDEKGYITVNDQLETSTEGIYALGDVKGGPAFTHIAFDDYRIIYENMDKPGSRSVQDRPVPYCMFIDPQLGRVGITETEAKEKGMDVKVAVLKNESVARSIETGDERGMMKAVVDAYTGQILGASILAEQGGEIVTILQMAMMGGITYDQIMNSVFAHPTYAESLNNLFSTLEK
ncbi:mercuric reductase [Dyadobacter sandarakinus]|uniref:Mercuric reductase n=1 Tax=Dyadobacter sandarakinus TaxID=2747268 RepID=A0ABX7I402_9BACT|nr:mercuric reductase [Dyadobacter sandarakinus]QRR00520.1 mercuric reductase [Dyadobacter sandarakinus]